jgi:hypothetical protein
MEWAGRAIGALSVCDPLPSYNFPDLREAGPPCRGTISGNHDGFADALVGEVE